MEFAYEQMYVLYMYMEMYVYVKQMISLVLFLSPHVYVHMCTGTVLYRLRLQGYTRPFEDLPQLHASANVASNPRGAVWGGCGVSVLGTSGNLAAGVTLFLHSMAVWGLTLADCLVAGGSSLLF